jgi:hypothetical protein
LCGGVAGVLSSLLYYPFDLTMNIVRKMPAPTGKDTYRNFYLRCIDHFQETLKEKGIKGIFKGFGLVSAFMFFNRSVYFGLYHSLKPHFPN